MKQVFAFSIAPQVPERPGVYAIQTRSGRHRYVGSTSNLRKRYRDHLSELVCGIHNNKSLQKIFNRSRTVLFFRVLEYCKKEELLRLEQTYLDKISIYSSIHWCNRQNKAGSGH